MKRHKSFRKCKWPLSKQMGETGFSFEWINEWINNICSILFLRLLNSNENDQQIWAWSSCLGQTNNIPKIKIIQSKSFAPNVEKVAEILVSTMNLKLCKLENFVNADSYGKYSFGAKFVLNLDNLIHLANTRTHCPIIQWFWSWEYFAKRPREEKKNVIIWNEWYIGFWLVQGAAAYGNHLWMLRYFLSEFLSFEWFISWHNMTQWNRHINAILSRHDDRDISVNVQKHGR